MTPSRVWLAAAVVLLVVNVPFLVAGLLIENQAVEGTAVGLPALALTCVLISRKKAPR